MKGNKGFTLIELLAILVILAIIAVITTPVILGVIEDSRKSAAADKAWGTIDAIKLAFTQEQTNLGSASTTAYTNVSITDFKLGGTTIRVSGEKPTGGTFSIDANGNVTVNALVFGAYKCSNKDNVNKMVCTK